MHNDNNIIEYTVQAIVTKYQKHREEVDDKWNDKGHALELLGFLYINGESEQEKNDEWVKAFNSWEFEYEKGVLTEKEESFLNQFQYKEAVEYIIDHILREYDNPCKQDEEITKLVCSLLDVPEDSTIYNPFAGVNSYAIYSDKAKNYTFCGEESFINTFIASIVRSNAYGVHHELEYENSFKYLTNGDKSKYIVCTPPTKFNTDEENPKYNYELDDALKLLYQNLDDEGILYVVLPIECLSHNISFYEFREEVTNNRHLNRVFVINNEKALVIIEKKNHTKVLFDDATILDNEKFNLNSYNSNIDRFAKGEEDDFSRWFPPKQTQVTIDYKKIEDSLYCWCPIYYMLDNDKEYVKVFDIVKPITDFFVNEINYSTKVIGGDCLMPGWLEHEESLEDAKLILEKSKNPGVREIQYEDINGYDKSMWSFHESQFKDTKPVYIKLPKGIGFVVVGMRNNHIGYMDESPCELMVDPSFHVFIPKDGYTPKQLAYLLDLPEVRKQMDQCGLDFLNIYLQVPLLSEKERDQLVIERIDASKSEAERDVEQRFNKYEKEIHVRKHAISQNLSSFEALWNVVNAYRKSHEGKLSDDDMMGIIHKISVGDAFNSLDKYLKVLMNQAEHLAQVEYDWGDVNLINPNEFIKTFISNTIGTNYSNVYEEEPCDNCAIFMPYDAMTRVFHNIISNAVSHGFTDSSRKDYKIKFGWFLNDEYIFITIENNGSPISSMVKTDDLMMYGYSTALNENGHSGIGAYEISNIMNSQNGSAQIISSPKEEYSVKYVIKCPRWNLEIKNGEDGEHRIYRCAVGGK